MFDLPRFFQGLFNQPPQAPNLLNPFLSPGISDQAQQISDMLSNQFFPRFNKPILGQNEQGPVYPDKPASGQNEQGPQMSNRGIPYDKQQSWSFSADQQPMTRNDITGMRTRYGQVLPRYPMIPIQGQQKPGMIRL